MKKNNSFKVAFGGILLSISILSLYFINLFPFLELTMYGISSITIIIMIIEIGPKGGVILYVGTSLIGLILLGNKILIIPYILFFGLYGLVKYLVEKFNRVLVQWIIKIIFSLTVFILIYFFFSKLLVERISTYEAPLLVMIIIYMLVFAAYDYLLTIIINVYRKKIKKEKVDIKLSQ